MMVHGNPTKITLRVRCNIIYELTKNCRATFNVLLHLGYGVHDSIIRKTLGKSKVGSMTEYCGSVDKNNVLWTNESKVELA